MKRWSLDARNGDHTSHLAECRGRVELSLISTCAVEDQSAPIPEEITSELGRIEKERPGALLARRTEEGMEPDDLLCSRNARPQKALVGRAQWKINQPPSLRDNERAWRDHL